MDLVQLRIECERAKKHLTYNQQVQIKVNDETIEVSALLSWGRTPRGGVKTSPNFNPQCGAPAKAIPFSIPTSPPRVYDVFQDVRE